MNQSRGLARFEVLKVGDQRIGVLGIQSEFRHAYTLAVPDRDTFGQRLGQVCRRPTGNNHGEWRRRGDGTRSLTADSMTASAQRLGDLPPGFDILGAGDRTDKGTAEQQGDTPPRCG